MSADTPSEVSKAPARVETVSASRGAGLGTFGGVYTPSILTILGVIMYLRFGWVVGNVGLAGTLLIVTIATSITFVTTLSISEIATDQRVRIGGAYYMISRSLGIEGGGAVGIPLYLAQALSVALYTVGFAESVVDVFPGLSQRWVGVITTVLVAALAIRSARIAIRAQYFIMAAIGLSLISLLLGSPIEATHVEMWGMPAATSASFWLVFAVFFPAVTGIMAGVNMSGDLRDPARSIPRGTMAAVATGFVIYMLLPVILASRADAATLVADPLVMRRMALWSNAIILGIWGATLSSAVGSILGAPRVLQALARDGVVPRRLRWLGAGSGATDEPRVGTAVTLGVALVAVWFGNLNLIAPILTMFFLTTYGVLNLAAGVERFLGSPSFRPKFRVHWSVSLGGAFGCMAVMLLINPWATVIALIVVATVFFWLERRELSVAWGDVRRGIWMAVTRSGLFRLREVVADPKNWRPNLLVFSGAPTKRWHLIELATAITHNRGLLTVATVIPGVSATAERRQAMEGAIHEYLFKRGVRALVRVATGEDAFLGAEQLVEGYGLGALRPNTVLLGDSERRELRQDYCRMITAFNAMRRNVIIVREGTSEARSRRRRIDVWWGGLQRNGGLMMILAYLLQTSQDWRSAEVVLKMVVPTEEAAIGVRRNLENMIERTRTGARFEVIVNDERPFREILVDSSRDADLVMMGIARPEGSSEDFAEYFAGLQRETKNLPPTVFVLAAEDVAFGEVLLQPEPMAMVAERTAGED